MKKITLLTILLINYLGLAQAPTGYYDSADGLTAFELKTELKVVISNNFNSRTYGELLSLYATSDNDEFYPGQEGAVDQSTTILDMYSENPTGADAYNYTFDQSGANAAAEGGGYNREHLYPQGFFNSQDLYRNDAHHVVPSDILVNSKRNNFPFGKVGTAEFTSTNGSKLGNSITPGYSLTVFEPIDEFKGDIARSLLYFATRYEDNWNDNSWDGFEDERDPRGGPNKGQWYETWFINLLLEWHAQDPVSPRELDRNNEIYTHQNNRNPFIDKPEYVSAIWGNIENIVAIKGDLTGSYVDTNGDEEVSLGDEIEYVYSITNAGNKTLFNINISSEKGTFDAPTSLDNLTAGTTSTTFSGVLRYSITQADLDSTCKCVNNQTTFTANTETDNTGDTITGISDDPSINTNVDTDNDSYPDDVTITDLPFPRTGGANANDLFISEYIEGSSFNKAIEVANFTGAAVDLSNYSLKRNGNGGTTWSGTAALVGILNDGEVYVVINNKAAEANIIDQADLVVTSTGSAVIDFNGDDPVGLFKNDVLVDIVGTFGVRVSFAENTTLVRKSDVTDPNLNFDLDGEWTSYPINTSTDLGKHTYGSTAGENDELLSIIQIYPNPSKGTFYIKGMQQQVEVQVYDVSGRRVLIQKMIDNQFTIGAQGIYLVKVTADTVERVFKVIVE